MRARSLLAAAAAIAATLATAGLSARMQAPPLPAPPRGLTAEVAWAVPILPRDTLTKVLERAGLGPTERSALVASLQHALDPRRLRAGSEMIFRWTHPGCLTGLQYQLDQDRLLQAQRRGEAFEARLVEIPSTTRVITVRGRLQSSLFESMEQTGEQPELALRVAEIFAWDIDFYTDPQPGDEFSILVEKKEYGRRQPPVYKRILAARYVNAGKAYEAYLFPDAQGRPRYFSADGRSLRSPFLRSPLMFTARISSRFSMSRLHPILKIRRPHLGIDYAAPAGTPVQAVGAGTVSFAGWKGQAGLMVSIQHAGGYSSHYLHLGRILVRAGQRVEQGQQIGVVGATGLATGPHLDFRFQHRGRYLNFERLQLPRFETLEASERTQFAALRQRYAALLDAPAGAEAIELARTAPEPAPRATARAPF